MILFFNRLVNFLKKDKSYILKRLLQELLFITNRVKYKFPVLLIPKNITINRKKILLKPIKDPQEIGSIQVESLIHIANKTITNTFDLLGSGDFQFTEEIDWSKDFISGFRWENKYCHSYSYNDLDKNNDVKVPWELSRHQFLVNIAQAYVITNEDKYIAYIEKTITHWIKNNPFAHSITWACTMDVALRAISWIAVHDLVGSDFSQDFKSLFYRNLYLHGVFIQENIEVSDINGNHYLSDSVGLMICGHFFNQAAWIKEGLDITETEIFNQTYKDGPDFEGSIPYHRLVLELFFLGYISNIDSNYNFSEDFLERLQNMVYFVSAYRKPDHYVPIVGDNDNGRAIVLSNENLNDHNYLLEISNHLFGTTYSLPQKYFYHCWIKEKHKDVKKYEMNYKNKNLYTFPDSNYYIYKKDSDYLFIECSDIGLGGRGGHGHNDFTSFELSLNGTPIIIDSGCYSYTSNYKERNNFRSSKYHNILTINDKEQNDFVDELNLWQLKNDIKSKNIDYTSNDFESKITITHDGFKKISEKINYTREFTMNDNGFSLNDFLSTESPQDIKNVSTYLHFHHDTKLTQKTDKNYLIEAQGKVFSLNFSSSFPIEVTLQNCDISYNFGTKQKSKMMRVILKPNSENLIKGCNLVASVTKEM